ncbi:MAG: hypothetical protein ACRD0G_07325 [Acidimicrobiales bacterium]
MSIFDEVTKRAKDAVYVGVGLSVIAFQKGQVQRNELTKTMRGRVDDSKDQLQALAAQVDERVRTVEERLDGVEERIDSLLDDVEGRLPEQAQEIMRQTRQVARDAREQVRGIVRRPD